MVTGIQFVSKAQVKIGWHKSLSIQGVATILIPEPASGTAAATLLQEDAGSVDAYRGQEETADTEYSHEDERV
jgi:hypothetical protein